VVIGHFVWYCIDPTWIVTPDTIHPTVNVSCHGVVPTRAIWSLLWREDSRCKAKMSRMIVHTVYPHVRGPCGRGKPPLLIWDYHGVHVTTSLSHKAFRMLTLHRKTVLGFTRSALTDNATKT
jgi:hypothetical protein